ncbi:MAG TPA: SH3 domain-containing protein [Rhodopila sp.]|nr:SH3 domain-containing protein [Rhodopila sp.]
MLRHLAVVCALALASSLISRGHAAERSHEDTAAPHHGEKTERRHAPTAKARVSTAHRKPPAKPTPSIHPPAAPHGPARAVPPSTTPAPPPPAASKPERGTVTGRLLPRFAALRANKVNMRVGPGLRYRIQWVYQRRGLPVEIMREFENWRLVQDPYGVKGWMHQATLMDRRYMVVIGGQQVLRDRPNPHAPAVARLDQGVVGRIRQCATGSAWCRVKVDNYSGWLPRRAFWGTLPGEAVNGSPQ